MTRNFSVLFVLTVFLVSLLGASALAANATQGRSIPAVAKAEQRVISADEVESEFLSAPASKVMAPSYNTSLGYYLAAGTVVVGSTGFDNQSNDRQQRQIVVGCSNNIHNVFMYRPLGASSADREIHYTAYVPGSPVPASTPISPLTGGYGAVDAGTATGGKAVATWHYTYLGDTSYTQCGMQPSCASTAFPNINYPFPPNCQGRKTGLGARENYYIWPSVAVDDNGGQPIAHVLAMEFTGAPTNDTTGKRSLIYYKSANNITSPSATCGTFIDSMGNSTSSVVVADPGSNKVAIVYTRPRSWGNGFQVIYGRDNVGYRESNDLGASWGSFVQVTNYSDTEELIEGTDGKMFMLRASDVSALYDTLHNLHILWLGQWQDSATSYYLVYPSKMFHWDAGSNCITQVYDASNYGAGSDCQPPGGQNNLARINLTQCAANGQVRLYAVYTRYRAYITSDSTFLDCSTGNYQNGEVFAQGSTTNGKTWGEPVNLTNTVTDNCAPGSCNSESFTSSAMYVTDSLRIQYVNDKDAGNRVVYTQGTETDNPVMNISYPCFTVPEVRNLTADPAGLTYPKIHTTPGNSATDSVTLSNSGNADAHYSISLNPNVTWLTFPAPAPSGIVPAGCSNNEVIKIQVTGGPRDTLCATNVIFSYEDGKTLTVPVEMWNFSSWFLPEDQAIRTANVRMNVQQTSRVSHQTTGKDFYFFGNARDYLYDGSLVVGNSDASLSMLIFESPDATNPPDPTIKPLYALSNTVYDSTTYPSYRYASGTGCNRDTTIKFDCEFYAPVHVDSSNFMIGVFDVYSDSGSINDVTVAYAADWDIPDDSSDNTSGYDEALQMVYQQGVHTTNNTRFGALAGIRSDNVALPAGFVLDNPTWVYPHSGYKADSIWTKMTTTVGYEAFLDSVTDMNSVLVFARGMTLTTTPFKFYVIFAGQPQNGDLGSLKADIAKAKAFICTHIEPSGEFCCNTCGDANGDGTYDISDAVYLIQYIFVPGSPAPGPCGAPDGLGDANGDGTVDISDAVYLIQYIFVPGSPAPTCP